MSLSPLAQSLADRLKRAIEAGELPDGRPLPAERDLATEHGVSRMAVRRAIGQLHREGYLATKPHCRPVVRSRPTRPAMRELQRATCIALWMWPGSNSMMTSQVLDGIHSGLAGMPGYKLVMGTAIDAESSIRNASERRFLEDLAHDPDTAGLILWYLGGSENLSALHSVREAGIPMVFLDREPPSGIEADFVGSDNLGSARVAVEHLIGLGHRRIACIRNRDEVSSVQDRVQGWRSALQSAGIAVERGWLQAVEPHVDDLTDREAVERALRAALQADPEITAVFCINDSLAMEAYEVCTELGIAVPGRLSIMGFDGLLSKFPGGGHISTAWQQFRRWGELAIAQLRERIEGELPDTYRHYLIDAPLHIQGSTSRPPALSAPAAQAAHNRP